MIDLKNKPFLNTASGRHVYLDHVTEDVLSAEDIAHNLNNICRFGGSTKYPFSVLQHSFVVHDIVAEIHMRCIEGRNKSLAAALLHDAAESIIGDIPSPLKSKLPYIKKLEARIMKVIMKKWKLADYDFIFSKEADLIAMYAEASILLPGQKIFVTKQSAFHDKYINVAIQAVEKYMDAVNLRARYVYLLDNL